MSGSKFFANAFASLAIALVGGCSALHGSDSNSSASSATGFGSDVAFLKNHGQVVILSDTTGKSKVAIAPGLQARVMTSTASGDGGMSYGWINRQYFDDAAAG